MQQTKGTFWTMENSQCIWKCTKTQDSLKDTFCLKLLSWDNGIHPYSYNCTRQELTAKTRNKKWWLETTSLPFGKLRPIFRAKLLFVLGRVQPSHRNLRMKPPRKPSDKFISYPSGGWTGIGKELLAFKKCLISVWSYHSQTIPIRISKDMGLVWE